MNLLFANDRQGEYPNSLYLSNTTLLAPQESLTERLRCDVCVIGGGYTGLSTALHLSAQGVDVVLLEAHRVGFGASGRNGGQVGTGYNLEQKTLESIVGKDTAIELWKIAECAKSTVKNLIKEHDIECEQTAGVALASWNHRHLKNLEEKLQHLDVHYQYNAHKLLQGDEVRELLGTSVYPIAVLDQGASHIHPLKYAIGLADAALKSGATIFENSLVTDIEAGQTIKVKTTEGAIEADKLVIACNGYIGQLQSAINKQVMPINNFIVATEPLNNLSQKDAVLPSDIAVYDTRFVVNYFRLSRDNRLVFGGGENYGYSFPENIEKIVRKPLEQVYPQLKGIKIDYAWGGTLAITANRMPCFHRQEQRIFAAGGYSGQGVALASETGKIITEAIRGNTDQFDLLASVPTLKFPGGSRLRTPLQIIAMSAASLVDRFS